MGDPPSKGVSASNTGATSKGGITPTGGTTSTAGNNEKSNTFSSDSTTYKGEATPPTDPIQRPARHTGCTWHTVSPQDLSFHSRKSHLPYWIHWRLGRFWSPPWQPVIPLALAVLDPTPGKSMEHCQLRRHPRLGPTWNESYSN